ncbi:MAG: extracellular solute-binding protein [Acidobacteriota bacterium]
MLPLRSLLSPSRSALLSLGLFAAGLSVALGLVGCGGDGRTKLVLYSPHGRDLLELVEAAYEAENPQVDVRWLDMGSQEVYDRIRSERANPQADVWFGGPDTIFARGAEEGLLQPFRPSWADSLPAASQHEGDTYFGLYIACPVLVYNSDAVNEQEAPKDWEDLLDPRWADQVLIRDPLASGTMRTAFGMILAQSVAETGSTDAGFEWLRRLDAQTKEYTLNPALLFEKLTRQEGVVSIWEITDILLLERRGSPLRYQFAASGTPVIDDAVGVVAGSRRPEAAQAFIEWVGSEAALQQVAEEVLRLPARQDLDPESLPPWAQEVLAQLTRAEYDAALVTEKGAEWMQTWDRTVRGRGLEESS